jgi:hypothetical protein
MRYILFLVGNTFLNIIWIHFMLHSVKHLIISLVVMDSSNFILETVYEKSDS